MRLASAYDLISSRLQLSTDLPLYSYYNFEVAFAYQSVDSSHPDSKSKNIQLVELVDRVQRELLLTLHVASHSLLIEFFLGAFDWFHLPIPIWIQVESIAGTVRLRCQMIQEFPYIRNVCRACTWFIDRLG
jgi:hypothetical protein